jgi:predicted nucleotidyltransferase
MDRDAISLYAGPVMIGLLRDKQEEIEMICKAYGVRRLDLFGSAATGAFDVDRSDLDFIVDLGVYERGVSKRYFAFCEALESLFGRSVDVITVRQIVNPYFRAELNATKELIYDAEAGEAAS